MNNKEFFNIHFNGFYTKRDEILYSIKNSNQNVNKSFETPRFNYQSPSFNVDMKNSYNSNHMQNSLQSNPGILSSFNAYNAPKI